MLEYRNSWPTSRAAILLWYCRSAATSYSKASYTAGWLPYSTDGRYTALPAALAGFKSRFDLHILNENLHFYCFVEERSTSRPEDQDMIRGFRSEMNAIARAVVNFVKKYRSEGVSAESAPEFLVELRQIGALLLNRIEREEKDLYTLYRP